MKIHFIGIGENTMCNLALALQYKGYTISGSDCVIFESLKTRLANKDLLPESFGWFSKKIHSGLDAVILGMHVKFDNPELLKAQELDIAIYSYPMFLFEQSKNKTRVVIGGNHGKTIITSMILHVLNYHDIAVDYMVGGQLKGDDCKVHLTEENDFMIIEADEYESSSIDRRPKFHLYKPNIALLSGITWNDTTIFSSFENYVEQFQIFVDNIVKGGSITYNEEDAEVKKLVEYSENTIRKLPYRTPEYTVIDGQTLLETSEGLMPVEVFGKHNLSNLSGAKWICQNIGVDEDDFYQAIVTFKEISK